MTSLLNFSSTQNKNDFHTVEEEESASKSAMYQDEELLGKTKSQMLIEHKTKKKGIVKKPRYTQMNDVIDKIRQYVKLENERKIGYFKRRKVNPVEYTFRRRTKTLPKVYPHLQRAELEMGTIFSLREMYFNRPTILNEIEEVKTKQELTGIKLPGIKTEVLPSTSVVKPYLEKHKIKEIDVLFEKISRKRNVTDARYKKNYNEIKKSRNKIRDRYVLSVFNIDDDNIFNNRELFKIQEMKRKLSSVKKRSHKKIKHKFKEVWDWNEFEKRLSISSEAQDSSTISEPRHLRLKKGQPTVRPELYLKQFLINWFKRESPPEDSTRDEFQFFKRHHSRKYAFENEKSRLNAAIKFLKYAKIVHPDLECMKVLSELNSYVGTVTFDELQIQSRTMGSLLKRPNKNLRYFNKLLKETKELEKMFDVPKETETSDGIKDELITLETAENNEDKLKNLLGFVRLSKIHDAYVDSCLPHPFDSMFRSIANSLVKYTMHLSCDSETKEFKREVRIIIAKMLQLILESMKWFVETIFRSSDIFNLPEFEKSEKETTKNDETPESFREEPESVIKKLMVQVIKYTNLNSLLHDRPPDISSTDCTSVEEDTDICEEKLAKKKAVCLKKCK